MDLEPITNPVPERLTDVVAEKDRLSSFPNNLNRRLQKLEVEIANLKVEKNT